MIPLCFLRAMHVIHDSDPMEQLQNFKMIEGVSLQFSSTSLLI